ncbi:uncharacterized protein LOC133288478 [Gastrolobium bilobum]|uniref:uncharacterized protein LOC133288478 n=1 Tax=Gastrolobium bilobum TaxID=150636 RepID=UPI002AB2F88F|nr:uncharacterized protein LOC133288478 [Gastrolobium bilobum]
MGKRIGTRFLMARLQRLWNLVSTYKLIDLDNGYLLLRFHDDGDYVHVLEDGPWIVIDHYVVVQRWRPFFDPYYEGFKKMVVWIRVPGLSIEFYTAHYLWKVGNLFGRTLKVDRNSLRKNELGDAVITERAKFARICVEVDLGKSLLSKFKIGNKIYQVGYEGIHLICFKCGVYGHRQDQCGGELLPKKGNQMEEEPKGQTNMEEKSGGTTKENCKEEEAFGSWMVV